MEWLADLELWLNPLYWVYLVADYLWDIVWCSLVPESCA
jgi:hypothetical protein